MQLTFLLMIRTLLSVSDHEEINLPSNVHINPNKLIINEVWIQFELWLQSSIGSKKHYLTAQKMRQEVNTMILYHKGKLETLYDSHNIREFLDFDETSMPRRLLKLTQNFFYIPPLPNLQTLSI